MTERKDVLGKLFVLVAADKRKHTGKTFRNDGGKTKADKGAGHSYLYRWRVIEVDAQGAWLEELRDRRDRFPIIGSPVADWAKGTKRRRLKRPRGDDPAGVRDTPCFMLPIDVDQLPFEIEGDLLDGLNVAKQVMEHLEIAPGAKGFWHLTSSHAMPDKGARVRLWIVLDEPMRATEMKALAKRLWKGKVDSAIYSPNAEIFTSDPEFLGDTKDPMRGRDRSGPLDGDEPWSPPQNDEAKPKRGPGRPRKAPYDRIKETLIAAGFYIADAGGGIHHIRCQHESEHSGEPSDTDTMYLEAGTDGHAKPKLFCHHDHCKARKDYHDSFMALLGLDRDLSVDDFVFVTTSGIFFMIPIRAPIVESGINAMLPAIRVGEDEFVAPATHIRRHKFVATVTWAPGRDVVLAGEAWTDMGPIYKEGLSSLNTYLPSQHESPKNANFEKLQRKARRWIRHVIRVFPDSWTHIIDVFAFKAQNPGEKINHCIVFDGVPRIGKDSIIVPVIYAVGAHNCASIGPAELVGRFNKFERSVFCVINETSDSGEMNKYKFYEHTKAMFASPPISRSIDEKNLGAYHIPNTSLYVITTNSAKSSLHLPPSDGRYYVASSRIANRDVIDPDGTYFEGYYRWLYEEGGQEAVADYLMALDVSHFDPKRPPPRTQAWWNVVSASNAEEDVALYDALDKLKWPKVIALDDLTKTLPGFEVETRNAMKALVHRLDRLERAYVVAANTDASDGRWKVGDKKITYYALRAMTVPERMRSVRERIDSEKKKNTESQSKGDDDDLL